MFKIHGGLEKKIKYLLYLKVELSNVTQIHNFYYKKSPDRRLGSADANHYI